jgi:Tn3 transposase DDE domain
MWDDLLRVAASVKGGHATAALVVGKLCSSRRQQNALAAAIKEYGALRRTVYAARYLADETYRRRIGRQLNKGENLHALKRSLAYAGAGALRRRHHEQQAEQMWCLTLATNAVVTWTTEYHGLAVTALRRAGRDIDDAVLAHIWPTHHENVHFYGTHSVDVDGELAKLDSDGYRPLRTTTALTVARAGSQRKVGRCGQARYLAVILIVVFALDGAASPPTQPARPATLTASPPTSSCPTISARFFSSNTATPSSFIGWCACRGHVRAKPAADDGHPDDHPQPVAPFWGIPAAPPYTNLGCTRARVWRSCGPVS